MKDNDVVLLMEVNTFYQGEIRKGIVRSVAKKRSKRTGIKYYWIEFADLHSKFEKYGHTMKRASVLEPIRIRKPRVSTKKVLRRKVKKDNN